MRKEVEENGGRTVDRKKKGRESLNVPHNTTERKKRPSKQEASKKRGPFKEKGEELRGGKGESYSLFLRANGVS